MTYRIEVKQTIQQTDIIIETTAENKEDVELKVKELHELLKSYQKELNSKQKKVNPPQLSPIFVAEGTRI